MKLIEEESSQVEYKRELPKENGKWLKTIVSFSNGSGGQLKVGIEDDTLEVVGVKESRSILEQRVSEAIFTNISPAPSIQYMFQNYDNKDVFIIKVVKGNKTPYKLIDHGVETVYIRFGSTDQLASDVQVEELKLNAKNETYTNLLYRDGPNISEASRDEINSLLRKIESTGDGNRKLTVKKLIEWNLLKEELGVLYKTNGFELLENNEIPNAYIRLGCFAGEDKADILYDREIKGSIIDQFDKTLEILEDKLTEHYEINKVRKRVLALPIQSLREVVANAIIHRQYIEEHPIRVEIYSNRVKVISPGALPIGMTESNLLDEVSYLRNSNIAEAFKFMGYIESWGSGISRANKFLVENGQSKLDIQIHPAQGVIVTMYFEKHSQNSSSELVEIQLLSKGREFTRKDLENSENLTVDQARRLLEKLQEEGKIKKIGSGRNTKYQSL